MNVFYFKKVVYNPAFARGIPAYLLHVQRSWLHNRRRTAWSRKFSCTSLIDTTCFTLRGWDWSL